ncbi:MAG: polyprenyl synthetase family protein [Deferrisomatales bacterium]
MKRGRGRDPSGPAGVEGYLAVLRPLLESAVARRISEILAPLPWFDRPAVELALEGGKKLRGSLLCLVCESLGGARGDALPRAVAVELIQAASLIHDDILDADRLRRGRPSVWALAGVRRAVLLGDVLFATAIEAMSRLGPDEAAAVSRAIARIAQGACSEPLEPVSLADALEGGSFGGDAYERILHLKTGVLFGVACRLGAGAAGADHRLRSQAERYGTYIGEAYQIADDLEDLARLLDNDIIDPGRASPLAPALAASVPEGRARAVELLRGVPLGQTEIRRLRTAAAAGLEEALAKRLDRAERALAHGVPAEARTRLRQAPRHLIRLFREGESSPVARSPGPPHPR